MDATHHMDIKAHLRRYYVVFAALTVGTILTVAASQIPATPTQHVLMALFIAIVKASLVAAYFMHLISERKALYSILVMTVFFFATLLALPNLTHEEMAAHPQIIVHPGPPAISVAGGHGDEQAAAVGTNHGGH